MTRSEIIRFLILRSIGNFLVLFAIFGVIATFGLALYLFAHSTDNFWDAGRYNAVFYLIKNLVRGEEPQERAGTAYLSNLFGPQGQHGRDYWCLRLSKFSI
ncbi:hypothetical protein HYZ70_01240 [Candidatus Curtissbacteria bacterium]|nr:hypothetical protein [Candidatus Curtissbacteria bacterium]